MDCVKEVTLYFGGKANLARALGVTLTAVSKWKDYFPKGRAYQIEVLTEGKFKADQLTYQPRRREHGELSQSNDYTMA
ncbi:MAG: helix-turn-helix domain-containing protein [Proteobacteria bacterium]|nr:helix-turn-helix domain-containing protein [Pseudomonadota bacterium]